MPDMNFRVELLDKYKNLDGSFASQMTKYVYYIMKIMYGKNEIGLHKINLIITINHWFLKNIFRTLTFESKFRDPSILF